MIEYFAAINQGGSTGDEWFRMDEGNKIPTGLSINLIEDYINLLCIEKAAVMSELRRSTSVCFF